MPDPREAVYDVLLAKKRRAEEEEAKQRQRVGEYQSHADAWAAYEAENRHAEQAYRRPRGGRA